MLVYSNVHLAVPASRTLLLKSLVKLHNEFGRSQQWLGLEPLSAGARSLGDSSTVSLPEEVQCRGCVVFQGLYDLHSDSDTHTAETANTPPKQTAQLPSSLWRHLQRLSTASSVVSGIEPTITGDPERRLADDPFVSAAALTDVRKAQSELAKLMMDQSDYCSHADRPTPVGWAFQVRTGKLAELLSQLRDRPTCPLANSSPHVSSYSLPEPGAPLTLPTHLQSPHPDATPQVSQAHSDQTARHSDEVNRRPGSTKRKRFGPHSEGARVAAAVTTPQSTLNVVSADIAACLAGARSPAAPPLSTSPRLMGAPTPRTTQKSTLAAAFASCTSPTFLYPACGQITATRSQTSEPGSQPSQGSEPSGVETAREALGPDLYESNSSSTTGHTTAATTGVEVTACPASAESQPTPSRGSTAAASPSTGHPLRRSHTVGALPTPTPIERPHAAAEWLYTGASAVIPVVTGEAKPTPVAGNWSQPCQSGHAPITPSSDRSDRVRSQSQELAGGRGALRYAQHTPPSSGSPPLTAPSQELVSTSQPVSDGNQSPVAQAASPRHDTATLPAHVALLHRRTANPFL